MKPGNLNVRASRVQRTPLTIPSPLLDSHQIVLAQSLLEKATKVVNRTLNDCMMLKSTHKPPNTVVDQSPLPSPWSEHVAPSGHKYYYNAETKQSTYVRPSIQLVEQHVIQPLVNTVQFQTRQDTPNACITPFSYGIRPASGFENGIHHFQTRQPEERPKSKHAIPGCAPWLLIKTRLGRRFVHNPVTKESLWKFPKDIIGGIVDFDIQERDGVEPSRVSQDALVLGKRSKSTLGIENSGSTECVITSSLVEEEADTAGTSNEAGTLDETLDEEYEEVEVTDSEFEDDKNPVKRFKGEVEAKAEINNNQQVEFGEEDMARQLAEMGQVYHLEPGEYGEFEVDAGGDEREAWEERTEGLQLTEEDATASFMDLLDDFSINPYTAWETVVSDGQIVEDDRYTLLPNMKWRKNVFADWSAMRIRQHKEEREKQLKQDPRIPYLSLLEKHATPKLYWPEFKRKHKKEPELRDPKLSDKDRENLYRDYITRITKTSTEVLKADLKSLMQSIPPSRTWNRSTSLEEGLPAALLADVRFISLKSSVRDPLILAYVEHLPSADDVTMDQPGAEVTRQERGKRLQELALSRRDKKVEETKERQQKELRFGRRRLQEEELELRKAMRVGKEGLLGHVGGDEG